MVSRDTELIVWGGGLPVKLQVGDGSVVPSLEALVFYYLTVVSHRTPSGAGWHMSQSITPSGCVVNLTIEIPVALLNSDAHVRELLTPMT